MKACSPSPIRGREQGGNKVMKTRITELLGIRYPIIQASMAWITDAELAAAVSKAGGLGTIGPNAGSKTVTTDSIDTGERLREQIKKCRELTDKPFAVNFVVGVIGWDRDFSDRCVEVGIEEQVPVAIVSQGNPMAYTPRLKDAGVKVIHVCSTVRHVRKAEEYGVDAVIASGTEGGGHSGFDQITTLCLVPQAVDAVDIPVIAGGGIVDARGLMGALSLGAEGVYIGTRFMATKECPTHPNVKQAILEAMDTSTMAIRHGSPVPANDQRRGDRGFVEERRGSLRMLVNDFAKKVLAEKGGVISFEEALNTPAASDPYPESNRTVSAFVYGDLENNTITAGQGSGMIHDIPTCRELIERMVGETKPILQRLSAICGVGYKE
jgi:NAD(P)H-dependent flavin oxidoreductase YrpB (nitropropane dioxygenase family)